MVIIGCLLTAVAISLGANWMLLRSGRPFVLVLVVVLVLKTTKPK
jgi:hypothetical protein